MVLDIHSHILPNVDDGAKDVEESLALLKMSYEQGIKCIVATPHFDANEENIEGFKEVTEKAYQEIADFATGKKIPEIYLGSEVYYFRNIGKSSGIRELTLGKSNYILLELPLCSIDSQILKDITDINRFQGLVPIIAHIERYSKMKGYKKLLKLVSTGTCLAQINASSVLFEGYQKIACKLLKKGYVSFVASDAHSVEHRPPLIKSAMDAISNVFDKHTVKKIESANEYVYYAITGKNFAYEK